MKRYRYFLFDLDGTLTDSAPGVTESVRYVLGQLGIPVDDPEKLRGMVGPPLTESFPKYFGLNREQTLTAIEMYRARYGETGVYENSVIPGIPEILEGLHERGAKIAVASSKPEAMVQKVLETFDLAPWFDAAAGSDYGGTRETKEDIIREVFVRLGIDEEGKKQTLMIGDRRYDVAGAHACGIDCLAAYIGYAETGELEASGAEYVAADMDEMRKLLFQAAEEI